jgi:hypothetical protein
MRKVAGARQIPKRLQFHEYRMTSGDQVPKERAGLPFFREWLPVCGVSLAVSLMVVSPFFWKGNASGHDIQFHAGSWLDVAGQWKEGTFYPRWAEWSNHGFGEPRYIFYPPLSWMLGAALSFLVPWNAVPGAFIVLVQTLAGVFTFAALRRALPERAALFGAACYAANPNALLMIYMRSDFAELLASAFFPLVILNALRIAGMVEDPHRNLRRSIVAFAIVFAAVWLSNAPAGVMASYSVAVVFAWGALTQKSLLPVGRGIAGLALGFGLGGFYLLPAAYEQRWVHIGEALSSGLVPVQNFLYTRISDAEHTAFNFIASNVAVLLIAMTGLACAATWKQAEERDRKRAWQMLSLLAAAATLLMLRFTSILWDVLPKLKFVQFPWRWMSTVAVVWAFFLAAASARRKYGWIWIAATLMLLAGTATYLVPHAWWDTEDIPVLQAGIEEGKGFDGTDEYDPVGDDHYDLPEKTPLAEILSSDGKQEAAQKARIKVERWSGEDKEVSVTARAPVRIGLRVLNYPAWQVEVNRKKIMPQKAEESGQMIVPVLAGESRIEVRFVRTADRSAGDALSLAGMLGLLTILWASRSRRL